MLNFHAALLLSLLALGCDSSGPTTSTPTPPATVGPTPAQECENYVTAYCGRFVDCQPDPMRSRADQLAACKAQLESGGHECTGAVGVSASFARCLDDVAGAGCDVIGSTVPDSCRGAIKFP